jgi:hypothetical protein
MSKNENEVYLGLEYSNIWTVDFYSWEMIEYDVSNVAMKRFSIEKINDFVDVISNSVIYLKEQGSKDIISSLGIPETRIIDKREIKINIKLKQGDKLIILNPKKNNFLLVEVLNGETNNIRRNKRID